MPNILGLFKPTNCLHSDLIVYISIFWIGMKFLLQNECFIFLGSS